MAANKNYNNKVYRLLISLCFLSSPGIGQGAAVLTEARRDVGIFEGRSNTGATQKYAVFWNGKNPKLSLQSPYCGLAVWYWYTKAGYDPNIKFSPRAINWKDYCKKPKSFFGLTVKELESIPEASAVVYKNSWGNHVGLFEKASAGYLYTYEGNTSTARSINKYSRSGEGVFYLKTSILNTALKPVYYCDCVSQSTKIR